MRGRISKIAGQPVVQSKVPPDARWAVDSDRGVTYAATQPEGSRLVAGQWWPPDYHGPEQLVSFDAELAKAFGIGVGDTVTVNILGRDIDARIASLRRIEWQTLAINFVIFGCFTCSRLRCCVQRLTRTSRFQRAARRQFRRP